MLAKLRKKFIRTAMASVLIVLVVILAAINCINYSCSDHRNNPFLLPGDGVISYKVHNQGPGSVRGLIPLLRFNFTLYAI